MKGQNNMMILIEIGANCWFDVRYYRVFGVVNNLPVAGKYSNLCRQMSVRLAFGAYDNSNLGCISGVYTYCGSRWNSWN